MSPQRPPSRMRHTVCALLGLCALLTLTGCGGSSGEGTGDHGTVAVVNQTNLGMAPLTVEQFFLEPVGGGTGAGNRLLETVPPGGVVIVGLFPPGLYNATAVLEGGVNQNWINEEIRAGEPKNFVIPGQ